VLPACHYPLPDVMGFAPLHERNARSAKPCSRHARTKHFGLFLQQKHKLIDGGHRNLEISCKALMGLVHEHAKSRGVRRNGGNDQRVFSVDVTCALS